MAFPDSAVPSSNCTPRKIELEIYRSGRVRSSIYDFDVHGMIDEINH